MTARPSYPYLNVAKAINQPYGAVLSYVDWLETNAKRPGTYFRPAYWQQQAADQLSFADRERIEVTFREEHRLRLEA